MYMLKFTTKNTLVGATSGKQNVFWNYYSTCISVHALAFPLFSEKTFFQMKSTVEGRFTPPEVPLDLAKKSNSTCKKHFWPRAAICQIAFNGREGLGLWLSFLILEAPVEVLLLSTNVCRCWFLRDLELNIMSCPTSQLISLFSLVSAQGILYVNTVIVP